MVVTVVLSNRKVPAYVEMTIKEDSIPVNFERLTGNKKQQLIKPSHITVKWQKYEKKHFNQRF